MKKSGVSTAADADGDSAKSDSVALDRDSRESRLKAYGFGAESQSYFYVSNLYKFKRNANGERSAVGEKDLNPKGGGGGEPAKEATEDSKESSDVSDSESDDESDDDCDWGEGDFEEEEEGKAAGSQSANLPRGGSL